MKTKLSVLAAIAALGIGVTAGPAKAHGCPPSFWKNQSDLYVKNPTVGSVFPGFVPGIARLRMKAALSLRGGNGLLGAQRLMARAAAAAYFNITVVRIYPVRIVRLKSMVRSALASRKRAKILSMRSELGYWNHLKAPGLC